MHKTTFERSRCIPAVTLTVSLAVTAMGFLSLAYDSFEPYPIGFLGTLAVSLVLLVVSVRRRNKPRIGLYLLPAATILGLVLILIVPEYSYKPLGMSMVLHRSFISALVLFAMGLPAASVSLYYLGGATPGSKDFSRYPLLLLPVLIALVLYGLIVFQVVAEGVSQLGWEVISRPYQNYVMEIPPDNPWGTWEHHVVRLPGMRDHILGTFLLMGLTAFISLPIGIGVGVFLSQYSRGVVADVVRFATMMLRAMSLLILGATALSFIGYFPDTFLSHLFVAGNPLPGEVPSGTFLAGSVFLSLLVIPVIARAAEEGCRSLPNDLREGSVALGASEGYTLTRLVLPWALPNIMTGLLLGCAEAAGSVAVIMFIAGHGDNGVGVFNEVTSLSFLIYDSHYTSDISYRHLMQSYQWSAAFLVLIITLGLTIGALILKRRFAVRFRGGR